MELIIRKVTKKDLQKLVELYNIVWPEIDYDKRKKTNFVLNESKGVCFCAEFNGEIVGSRTSIFENLFFGKRKLYCVQCGDSCVHPSFRGKGLFQRMNMAFLDSFFCEQPGELVYNISVEASRRSYEKLGWRYIDSLMKLRKFPKPLATLFRIGFRLNRLRSPLKWDHDCIIKPIDPKLLDIREELFSGLGLLHICYDEKTFYWRMKTESGIKSFVSENLGYILYKIGFRGKLTEVEIGEVFLYNYNPTSFNRIIKKFNNEIQPDILWVLVSEGHPLRRDYRMSFFFSNPKQRYLHHGVKVNTDEMKKICYNPYNWAISSLDIDTF